MNKVPVITYFPRGKTRCFREISVSFKNLNQQQQQSKNVINASKGTIQKLAIYFTPLRANIH